MADHKILSYIYSKIRSKLWQRRFAFQNVIICINPLINRRHLYIYFWKINAKRLMQLYSVRETLLGTISRAKRHAVNCDIFINTRF